MIKYNYGKQNISNRDILAVNKVLKSDFITQGKEIENFEKNYQNILVLNILQQPLVEQQLYTSLEKY